MKKNIVKVSLVAAMMLTSGAYSAEIVGADISSGIDRTDNMQFGYGGLNMDTINVNLITAGGTLPIDFIDGVYPDMVMDDDVESSVFNSGDDKSDEATRMGYIHQKPYPLSEPMGLKVINNDPGQTKGKPENCIMGSSYLNDENTTLLGPNETPVICSSPAGSNKRFSLALLPTTVADTALGEYGKSVDLVFNIDSSAGDHRYQVFQKVNNFTGMRLDGLTIEVLDATGERNAALTLSLGEGEALDKDGNVTGDLFPSDEIAFYPPGLWGDGSKDHLPTGWFDEKPAGYNVIGHNTSELNTTTQLSGNYVELFGNWIPEKWVAIGMHEVLDPLEEPVLLAYWGITPDEADDVNATPAWHYGMFDNDSVRTDFATPSQAVFDEWAAEPERFVIDDIEDLPNLSLNYIVNVGDGIDGNFTIRFTPKVSVDQTPPSYISKEDNITYILPPEADTGTDTGTIGGGSGGGCTYNPNSKNFDMTFLMMMALGLLYPFRRRFLK